MYERRRLFLSGNSKYPDYTYTGSHEFVDDGDGNWKIKLLTSGVLTLLNKDWNVDVFLVGGGGGGGGGYDNGNIAYIYGGGGGGGGYTKTVRNMSLTKKTPYNTVVGAGGTAGALTHTGAEPELRGSKGGNGGASTFNGKTAEGGKGGYLAGSGYYSTDRKGGDGGSGGGAGDTGAFSTTPLNGGIDGSDGGSYTHSDYSSISGGIGQGFTTREFEEANGTLYSTGGNGGQYNIVSIGGTANTGDGGDGGGIFKGDDPYHTGVNAQEWADYYADYGTSGGSGIVILRNARISSLQEYTEYERITESQTWVVPKDGWYQIEVFGASGNGGSTYAREQYYNGYTIYSGTGGSGGGGGGYSCSRVKMNKDDTVVLTIGSVGANTTAKINSSVETYSPLQVTSGANGSMGGEGGVGGVASGGNVANNNGNSGGSGSSYEGESTPAIHGTGGTPGYAGGNTGGNGGIASYETYGETVDGSSGRAGFIKIYGKTN